LNCQNLIPNTRNMISQKEKGDSRKAGVNDFHGLKLNNCLLVLVPLVDVFSIVIAEH
jgi:hypothetical protein